MSHVVYDAIIGDLTLRQIRSTKYSANARTGEGRAAGSTAPAELYLLEAQPMADFTTGDLGGVIGVMGMTSGKLVSNGSIVLPWNRRANGGTFAGGGSHATLSGANALSIPQTFEARQGDEDGATATVQTHFIAADGLTAPVVAAANQVLSASAFNALYEFGPVSINGSQLAQAISARVETGLNVLKELYDGDHYPRFAFIDAENIKPRITLGFANMDALATLGAVFASMSAVAVNFRKRVDGGTVAGASSPVHCRFSLGSALSIVDDCSGQNRQTGEVSITIEGKVLTASATSQVTL